MGLIFAAAIAASSISMASANDDGVRVPNYTNPFSRNDHEYTGKAVFKCSFTDIVTADDGKIIKGGFWANAFAEANGNFTFDAATGAFHSHGDLTMLNVVRQGSSQDDLVAHVVGPDPLATIMRIQAYSMPITFFMIDHMSVFTGTCVKL